MSQANSKHGNVADELLDVFNGVVDGLRITGPVRKEDSIRLHRQNVFGRSLGRYDENFALVIDEQAKDVLFDAVVVGDDTMFARFRLRVGFAHMLAPGRSGPLDL